MVAGNVRERTFSDIWEDASSFQRLRDGVLGGKCGRCDFQELCGGCRARAYALTGDLSGEDPWCSYQPLEYVPVERTVLPVWTREAEERLQRIPPFIRSRVKLAVERHAQDNHEQQVTPAMMTATLEGLGRHLPFKRPPGVGRTGGKA
ncbi:MAG: SPASM domain-containing protein [Gemmatimonadetes bacterium]|nr:SPASM domain-containing protein [Gemmatimonadota bacterium]